MHVWMVSPLEEGTSSLHVPNVAKRQTGLSEEAVGGLPVAFHMNCLKEQS